MGIIGHLWISVESNLKLPNTTLTYDSMSYGHLKLWIKAVDHFGWFLSVQGSFLWMNQCEIPTARLDHGFVSQEISKYITFHIDKRLVLMC